MLRSFDLLHGLGLNVDDRAGAEGSQFFVNALRNEFELTEMNFAVPKLVFRQI